MKTVLAIAIGAVLASTGYAQEWTRFRGPNGTGVSAAKTIPTKWTDADINWKVELPSSGHSSPVLWGDKIFLNGTGDTRGGFQVMCLSAKKGELVWKRDFELQPFSKHKFNSFASTSPAVDKDRIYVCYSVPQRYVLLALDHDGKTVWERDLGPFVSQHGCGASPMLYEDKVVLGNEQDGTSFIIAVDAKTGKDVWKTPRETAVVAYATPCVFQPKGGKPALLFTSQAHGIYALNPDDGKVLWEFPQAFDKRSVSSPVFAGDIIFGSCGSGGGGNFVTAVRAGDPEKGRGPQLAYQMKKSAPYVTTSVVMGDLIWMWSDSGIVTCVHAPTGDIRYQERAGGNFFGSPVWVDGRIFCISTAGEVVVLEASDKFNVLARYPLNELTHTTPAVAGGKMYIRTDKHLYSIGGRLTNATSSVQ